QILRHEGGVPAGPPPDPYGYSLWDYWRTMRSPDNSSYFEWTCSKGTHCYSNDNYVLATIMLALIWLPCDMRASIKNTINTACTSVPAGRHRQTCQIDYAFSLLGPVSNGIVQRLVMDPLGIDGGCTPGALTSLGYDVAKSYTLP